MGLFSSPKFPSVPPPRNPPPPPGPAPPPAKTDTAVQGAQRDTRDLFRRRGRKSTLLTPGGGAGVTDPVSPTRKALLGQ